MTVTELGQMLKEARVKKGLTIEDIHRETKIQSRYLEAIEQGNLEALPGNFYARAFVKSFAEVVGLPQEAVLEHIQFETQLPTVLEEPVVPLARGRSTKSTGQASKWLSKALLYSFAVLILFVIYIAFSQYDKGPKESQGTSPDTSSLKKPSVEGKVGQPPAINTGAGTGTSAPSQAPPAAPAPPPPPPKPTLAFVGQENNIYRYEISGVTDLSVKLTGSQDCWMRILKGGESGQQLDELTLTNGMVKEYSFGNQEAWIRMGSAPDVKIEVNGVPLDTSKMLRSSQILSITIKK